MEGGKRGNEFCNVSRTNKLFGKLLSPLFLVPALPLFPALRPSLDYTNAQIKLCLLTHAEDGALAGLNQNAGGTFGCWGEMPLLFSFINIQPLLRAAESHTHRIHGARQTESEPSCQPPPLLPSPSFLFSLLCQFSPLRCSSSHLQFKDALGEACLCGGESC